MVSLYDPTLKRFSVKAFPDDGWWIEFNGIPNGLERFETVAIHDERNQLWHLGSVFFISPDEDKFYLTWNKSWTF